jgi:hypothetical protein
MSVLRVARVLGFVRDLLTALVGLAVLISTPPSLLEFGADDIAAAAWSLLPLVGGLLSLLGAARASVRLEVMGAFTIASGFFVWAAAAALQAEAGLISYAVAGAFAILGLNAVVRGLIVATGLLTRTAAP